MGTVTASQARVGANQARVARAPLVPHSRLTRGHRSHSDETTVPSNLLSPHQAANYFRLPVLRCKHLSLSEKRIIKTAVTRNLENGCGRWEPILRSSK